VGLKYWVGRAWLGAFGWKAEGERPDAERYVLIAAPHTSNWDFPFTIALSFVHDVPIRWMGKKALFDSPLGWLYRKLGGIPVDRSASRNLVQQMIDLFDESEHLVLVVPAEGTRSRRPHWKSGFYHIAKGADVPIVCGYADFARKAGGFGPPITMTGDVEADMDQIRAFYSGVTPKFPEKYGPIRLKEEATGAVTSDPLEASGETAIPGVPETT